MLLSLVTRNIAKKEKKKKIRGIRREGVPLKKPGKLRPQTNMSTVE